MDNGLRGTPGDRLAAVRGAMAAAALRSGRDPGSVRLLAVSKFQPLEAVIELYEAGQRDFGENYAQHLRDRSEAWARASSGRQGAQSEPISLHAIGPLQLNKAKYVARAACYFHALERLEVAVELGRRRQGAPLPCLIEVNIAGEASKAGVSPDQLEPLCEAVHKVPGVALVGLMCMPPQPDDPHWTPERNRPHFARLRELALELGLPELSMGTTEDFEVAIEEGATWVRVGRRLFGERPEATPG